MRLKKEIQDLKEVLKTQCHELHIVELENKIKLMRGKLSEMLKENIKIIELGLKKTKPNIS